MALVELLPTVRALSRQDRLRLILFLAGEWVPAEGAEPIPAGQSYPLWSPDRAYDAAAVLLRALDAESGRLLFDSLYRLLGKNQSESRTKFGPLLVYRRGHVFNPSWRAGTGSALAATGGLTSLPKI